MNLFQLTFLFLAFNTTCSISNSVFSRPVWPKISTYGYPWRKVKAGMFIAVFWQYTLWCMDAITISRFFKTLPSGPVRPGCLKGAFHTQNRNIIDNPGQGYRVLKMVNMRSVGYSGAWSCCMLPTLLRCNFGIFFYRAVSMRAYNRMTMQISKNRIFQPSLIQCRFQA